jgi:hypothetical protein
MRNGFNENTPPDFEGGVFFLDFSEFIWVTLWRI